MPQRPVTVSQLCLVSVRVCLHVYGLLIQAFLQAVVLLSNATSVLGILAFGASTTFLQALLARLIPGMLNGCAVALKSMLGEACDVTNQARALAIFTLGWAFGSVVGPLLGGVLSEPCDNYGDGFPLCGPTGLFRTRCGSLCLMVLKSVPSLGLLVQIRVSTLAV